MSTTSTHSNQVTDSTTLVEFKPGKFIPISVLRGMLPDTETALFFSKVYELDYYQLSGLLTKLFPGSSVINALTSGGHSETLQSYLIDVVPDHLDMEDGTIRYDPDAAPPAQFLPQLWADLEVQVAKSIKEVAAKLGDTLALLPGKQGQMVFTHMAKLNKQRPTLGTYGAGVHHAAQVDNLVILDTSGSMTEGTIRALVDDVVALAWSANAHLVVVSNDAYHWEPGGFNADMVLAKAQFSGTHYEKLLPLMHRDWGTVITIADYDSDPEVRRIMRTRAHGSIQTVLDISLVNQPTFLSQCLGEIAREVKPLLIGGSHYVLT